MVPINIADMFIIEVDPIEILSRLKQSAKGKLAQYELSTSGIKVTCPHDHQNGQEQHPSCYLNLYSDKLPMMWYHCFTCNNSGSFLQFIMACLECDFNDAVSWIKRNYKVTNIKRASLIEPFKKPDRSPAKKMATIDESVLQSFQPYHPYMTKRGISDDIIRRFNLKYDRSTYSIVFPVYNLDNQLVFLTRRSVIDKTFIIDRDADKSNIYLLNECLNQNARTVVVCESQINALVAWSWGYPAIALFGAGTTDAQIEVLNKSGIRHFILAYDGDEAGDKGAARFCKGVRNALITQLKLPRGKDVADLTKQQFEQLIVDNT